MSNTFITGTIAHKLAVVASTVALTALAASAAPAQAGQLHVHTSGPEGFNTHSVWYDDGQEVTVVDTQFTPALAEALIADIKRQTRSPITRVVVTHPSPDKFNALSVFHREGAQSVASLKTAQAIPQVDAYKRYFWVQIAKSFTGASYPKVEAVKTTFSGQTQIKLKSGETLTLTELPAPGVASSQAVVRFDATGDIAVGDLVHHNTHAWLEGGIVGGKAAATLDGWRADLRALAALAPNPNANVYGGRGPAAPVSAAVTQQIAYLDRADEIVGRYITALGERKAELSDPARQSGHHAALQAEFVKAFPSYAMPELVGYSVYGLVQSRLAAAR